MNNNKDLNVSFVKNFKSHYKELNLNFINENLTMKK